MGGLPRMSQPVANTSAARITPLWHTATTGCGSAVSSQSSARRRAHTSRGFSPAGRPEIQAARLVCRHLIRRLCTQLGQAPALEAAPGHLAQARIERRRVAGEHARRRARSAERAAEDARLGISRRQAPPPHLRTPLRRQLDIGLPLDAPARVPCGRPVADQQDRRIARMARIASRRRERRRQLGGCPPDAALLDHEPRRRCPWPAGALAAPAGRAPRGEGTGSPGAVSTPLRPSATTSATPPPCPATTGSPAAWASSMARP